MILWTAPHGAKTRCQTVAKDTLSPRIVKRDHREYATEDGDLVVARRDAGVKADLGAGEWLVTATANDLTQVQGKVVHNEAGFRGRHWESAIDGQQYPSLIEAMREALSEARRRADLAAFARKRGTVSELHTATRMEADGFGPTADEEDALRQEARKADEAIMRTTVAQRMGETIEQSIGLARNPGLVGITKTAGIDSLKAVLEDLTRNVAITLTSTNEDYRAFMVAAGFKGYDS